jgi:predicted ester cyclase
MCGMAARKAGTQNRLMTASAPLDVYRQFQSFLLNGEYGRLAEVADLDRYTEHCVGLTGWTTGLQAALRNFQENIASRLTGMVPTENDVVQSDDMLVIRGSHEVTHSAVFLGVPPTGRRVSYDWVDMYRVTGGRIVWRYLLCDWKGLQDQLTASQWPAQPDTTGR